MRACVRVCISVGLCAISSKSLYIIISVNANNKVRWFVSLSLIIVIAASDEIPIGRISWPDIFYESIITPILKQRSLRNRAQQWFHLHKIGYFNLWRNFHQSNLPGPSSGRIESLKQLSRTVPSNATIRALCINLNFQLRILWRKFY